MARKLHSLWLITFIIALPIIGYGISYAMVQVFPMSEQGDILRALFVFLIILLLLAVPYFMLKLSMHVAHKNNPREREMYLADMPKDKDQLDRS